MGFRHATVCKSHFYQYYVVGRFPPPSENGPIPGYIILRGETPKATRELVGGVPRAQRRAPRPRTRGGVLGGEGVSETLLKCFQMAFEVLGSTL